MDLEPPIVGPHKLWDVIKDQVFPAHEVVKGKEVFSLLQSVNCDIAGVSLVDKCQDIDNPEFGSGCVNTSITRFKVQGTKREATGRVSRAPAPRQSKLGCGARE
jgi:hypothetical protein